MGKMNWEILVFHQNTIFMLCAITPSVIMLCHGAINKYWGNKYFFNKFTNWIVLDCHYAVCCSAWRRGTLFGDPFSFFFLQKNVKLGCLCLQNSSASLASRRVNESMQICFVKDKKNLFSKQIAREREKANWA